MKNNINFQSKSKEELISELIELHEKFVTLKTIHDSFINQCLQKDEELQKKTEELNNYFNNALDLFCIANTDGYFLKLNKAWEKTLGYSIDELEGIKFLDLVHPDDIELTIDAISQLSSQNDVLNFANRYKCKDGSYRIIEWQSKPIENLIYAGARDITERKKVEKEREQFYNFFMTSSDIMVMADPLGAFLNVNPACHEILGYSDEELISKPFVDFIIQEDKQETIDEMARQMQKGFSLNFENRYLCKDGSVKWLSWRAIFVQAEGITYATARDISERKQTEFMLKEKNEEIETQNKEYIQINEKLIQTNEALILSKETIERNNEKLQKINIDKDRFMSILGHDLRGPLNTIIGFTDLLEKNIRKYDIEKIENYAHHINQSTKKIFNLLEDLLLWANSQSGKITYSPQNITFKTICNNVIDILKSSAINKNITISNTIECDEKVFADNNMLQTILRNLISNAIKFTNRGGEIIISAIHNETNITLGLVSFVFYDKR